MLIIGCDFHTRYQQIAMAREETGESLVERRLDHESGEATPVTLLTRLDQTNLGFAPGLSSCYLSTPSSLQLSAFQ
jgi:hypothetical protein